MLTATLSEAYPGLQLDLEGAKWRDRHRLSKASLRCQQHLEGKEVFELRL
jgi:hypothetical protein